MDAAPLTPRQRKHLRGLAHTLEPVLHVGRAGVTPQLAAETDRSLQAHELIKVRLEAEGSEPRRRLADDLAGRTGSTIVGLIGKTAILYRARADEPEIRLPRA